MVQFSQSESADSADGDDTVDYLLEKAREAERCWVLACIHGAHEEVAKQIGRLQTYLLQLSAIRPGVVWKPDYTPHPVA